ncbi:hypothetical protein JTB14_003855 [Gonioctena quinquepunctata]|nr:hypothetical protein JTB14_003855 [Gonioctena quinquepunctata]
MVNRLIKNIKMDYYKKCVNQTMNDTKALWKTVKDISGNKKDIGIKSIKNYTHCLTYNQKKIADCFNNHYPSVGRNVARKINQPANKRNCSMQSIFLEPTTDNEIIETMAYLEINEASGIDDIRAESLEEIKTEIAGP